MEGRGSDSQEALEKELESVWVKLAAAQKALSGAGSGHTKESVKHAQESDLIAVAPGHERVIQGAQLVRDVRPAAESRAQSGRLSDADKLGYTRYAASERPASIASHPPTRLSPSDVSWP